MLFVGDRLEYLPKQSIPALVNNGLSSGYKSYWKMWLSFSRKDSKNVWPTL